MLTRDRIREGWIQKMIAAAGGGAQLLSEDQLRCSRAELLADHPAGEDLWVFGYGSLIWNPCFHYLERGVARVPGWHRDFCLWTHLGRGNEERPGLMLGLERGGSCRGIALRIAASEIETELDIVWRREMVTGAYRPRWVSLIMEGGRRRGIAFTINHAHERYARGITREQMIESIATAFGPLGTCCEYLFNTVEHLEELGISDRHLRTLVAAVRHYQAEQAFSPERVDG